MKLLTLLLIAGLLVFSASFTASRKYKHKHTDYDFANYDLFDDWNPFFNKKSSSNEEDSSSEEDGSSEEAVTKKAEIVHDNSTVAVKGDDNEYPSGLGHFFQEALNTFESMLKGVYSEIKEKCRSFASMFVDSDDRKKSSNRKKPQLMEDGERKSKGGTAQQVENNVKSQVKLKEDVDKTTKNAGEYEYSDIDYGIKEGEEKEEKEKEEAEKEEEEEKEEDNDDDDEWNIFEILGDLNAGEQPVEDMGDMFAKNHHKNKFAGNRDHIGLDNNGASESNKKKQQKLEPLLSAEKERKDKLQSSNGDIGIEIQKEGSNTGKSDAALDKDKKNRKI